MADSTLAAIQKKVRRITRTPSPSQLSDAELNEYINTFILYDLPENVRLFSLRSTFTFYTQPNVDVYASSTNPLDALYNFQNKYIAVHQPFYIAGVPAFFTQYRDLFFGSWPMTATIADTALRGDGVTTTFTGTITAHPMLQNNVIFTAVNGNGVSMVIIDYPTPTDNIIGALGQPNVPQTVPSPFGQINYITGVFTVTFPNPPAIGAIITSEVVAYQPGKPIAVLYYDNKFTIRPVPDKSYAVQCEVDIRPTELLNTAEGPVIEQYWQYIAMGASKKIFEDRMDLDSVAQLMPMYKEQENLVLRVTLTQYANERTQTIYTTGKGFYGFGGGWGSGWPY
jgi:hypothetical protein